MYAGEALENSQYGSDMIGFGVRKTTVVVSWRRDEEQVLAEAGAVVGDLLRGEDPSKLQCLRHESSLGVRRTKESELTEVKGEKGFKKVK